MEGPEVFRWILDVGPSWPSPTHIDEAARATAQWATGDDAKHALSLVTLEERDKILRFYRISDAKLSLGSSLLKHRAISQTCGVDWAESTISADSNKKPCYKPPNPNTEGLEFNVSHHGTLVALVGCKGNSTRLGVDVVRMNWERDYAKVMESGFEAWAYVFEIVFSDREIREIAGFRPDEHLDSQEEVKAKLRRFYASWCLKEAYVKMTGEALLASWLKDLEFRNVQVPLPKSQMSDGAATGGDWGQTCSDMETWFRGQRVTDVKLEIQAFRDDYMVGTACSKIDAHISAFRELEVEHDVYP